MSDPDLPVIPDLDPNWDPMIGEKVAPNRHPVRGHDRVLPPRPLPPEDPEALTLDLDLGPRQTPGPRIIPVRPHTRRNPRPRHKETHGIPDPSTPHRG